MAVHIIHSRLVIGGRDYTNRTKSVELGVSNDLQDATVMSSNTKIMAGSLNDLTLSVEALNEFGTGLIDADIYSKFGGVATQFLVSAQGGDTGEIGYMFDGVVATDTPISGNVGVLVPIKFNVRSGSDIVRGTILEDGNTTRSADGNSSSNNLGTVSATQYIWSQLQVLSGSAGTLDVTIESDDDTGFPSATTQLTHAQVAAASAPTSEFKRVAGAFTDNFWRAKWVIPSGNWTFLVTFGIQ